VSPSSSPAPRSPGSVDRRHGKRPRFLPHADLIYTLNGGERHEEWFRTPAEFLSDPLATAAIPDGTTHYFLNLVDKNRFLRCYPEIGDRTDKIQKYSPSAIEKQNPAGAAK
jgi:hypothetical protein